MKLEIVNEEEIMIDSFEMKSTEEPVNAWCELFAGLSTTMLSPRETPNKEESNTLMSFNSFVKSSDILNTDG